MIDEAARDLARDEFIVLYVNDRQRGVVRSVTEYLGMYPGCEATISEEWSRLRQILDATPSVGAPAEAHDTARPAHSWTLGRYRIERELGRGGQSTVFLAEDPTLGRHVAIKVLKASWSGSEALVKRFENEARALARLEHEGLATIYDAGSARGLQYFAMRHVEGHTLAREVTGQSLPGRRDVIRYVTLIEKVSRTLHAAHERGMVHRDVKPANIMVTNADEPVVLDFGLVQLRELDAPTLTMTGDLLGTPAFMAPEQVAGEKDRIDRRTDVYGIGATLHELVTGGIARPADGNRPRGSAWRTNPSTPRDLEAVLATALDPDPDRRYATAAALADDLERVRLGKPVAVRPPGPIRAFALWCRRAPAAAALVLIPPIVLGAGLAGLAIKNGEIRAAAKEFDEKKAEAMAAHANALARFTDFQRLDDLLRIDDLLEREHDLWPPVPDKVSLSRRWLDDARALTARLPEHRAALAALRLHGERFFEDEPGADPAVDVLLHARWVRNAALQEMATPIPAARATIMKAVVAEVDRRMPTLTRNASRRQSFRHARPEDQWLNDNLARLVDRLEALEGTSLQGPTIASVEHRMELGESLVEASLTRHAAEWQAAIGSIANAATDPAYRGLKIEPVLGLVPLGRDPRSRLWEFAHVLSGRPPVRGADGNLVVTPDSSIVLVLLPGGRARIGARHPVDEDEPTRDHVDPAASPREGPVQDVVLDPFFISKYEMTQGQWLRATGSNASFASPEREFEHGYKPDLRHPVEQVSFYECEEALIRFGLTIPTEAQWEYAARAGTTTPWWPGPTIASFLTNENLADRTMADTEGVVLVHDLERNDGWSGHAPVGTYPANPFGLHDVIGNVSEWCCDRLAFYSDPALPGDGLRDHAGMIDDPRIIRGGNFASGSWVGRSSQRHGTPATTRDGTVGVRPALSVREP